MTRFLWLGCALFLCLVWCGCGDTFRPIIIPNPPVFPNPKAAHSVVSFNDNGSVVNGTAMVIDVSGDTDVSVANVGLAPAYAVQQSASQVLVVNHSVTGARADSITRLNFNGTTIGSTTTISLPADSAPNFVAVAPSDTLAYVSLPNFAPPSVAVVNTQTENTAATVPVGNNPVALAVTPDKSKLYVANEGSTTISGFNTQGPSQRVGSPIQTSSPPIWLVARNDNQRVYALEESTGILAELDITATAGPDQLTEYPSTYSVPGA